MLTTDKVKTRGPSSILLYTAPVSIPVTMLGMGGCQYDEEREDVEKRKAGGGGEQEMRGYGTVSAYVREIP